MATHYDDEAQVDALKKWWKQNWLAIVAGLGIGLGAIFGWEGYKYLNDSRALTASAIFDDLRVAIERDDPMAARDMTEALARDHRTSPYATLAQMKMAEQAARTGELDAARDHLQWVMDHGGDDALKSVAVLRLARVEIQQGQLETALNRLARPPTGFEALYLELRGDVLLVQGERTRARVAYLDALAALEDGAPNRRFLQQKIDDLAEAAAS